MTIDRDALRRKATDRYTIFIRPDDLLALLDQLDAAERRADEAEAKAEAWDEGRLIGATALHPHYQPNPYRETGDQA